MKVVDDGVIKYDRSNFSLSGPIPENEIKKIEYWRKKLYSLNLIGEYPEVKVGFGNISEKREFAQLFVSSKPQFIISGTQTGKFSTLDGSQYTRVLDFCIEELKIKVMGPVEASSEALTHAAIYYSNSSIKGIIHVHSKSIWENMLKKNFPHTSNEIPYGTKEMAIATMNLTKNFQHGSFAMAGHLDGVVTYGKSLDEAGEIILDLYQRFSDKP